MSDLKYREATPEESTQIKAAMSEDVYKRFESLHGHMIESTAIVSTIHVTQATYDKLNTAFHVKSRTGEPPTKLVAFVTRFGHVKIKVDEDGVEL